MKIGLVVRAELLSYISEGSRSPSFGENVKQQASVGWIQTEKKGPSDGATTLLKQHSFLLDNGPLKVLIGG